MGVDTYTLTKRGFQAEIGGQRAAVHSLKYYARNSDCNPDWFGCREQSIQRAAKRRADYLIERVDEWDHHQDVYYIYGRPEEGAEVYFALARDVAVWHDCDPLPGNKVGVLHRQERRGKRRVWTLKTRTEREQYELAQQWERRVARERYQARQEERQQAAEERRQQQQRDESLDSSGL